MTTERQLPHILSPEFRLVAACSWVPKNAAQQAEKVARLSTEPLNWDEVATLVARHGLTGVFCLVMEMLGWDNVPQDTKELLKGQRLQHAARNLGQVAELSRITGLLAESGIDVIPLKGVALSQELYGDPLVRNSGDLDLLVRDQYIATVQKLLTRLGYRHLLGFHALGPRQQRHILRNLHHHEYIHDAKGVMVELHWRGFLWSEEQMARLWCGSFPADNPGGLQRHLSRYDNILFLADHGARHDWECLKWLSDVAMLLEGLSEGEWLALYERAACFDLQRVLLQTALLLEWFYGIVSPAAVKALLSADRMVASLAVSGAEHLLASREERAVRVKRFAGPRQALRIRALKPSTPLSVLFRNVMIKPEDFLAVSLPDAFYWLYIPLRPYFWFRRHYLSIRRN